MEIKNDIRVFESKSYSDFRSLIITGAASLQLFLTPFFYVRNFSKEKAIPLTIVCVIFVLIGIISLRKFLWLINGREILRIEEDKLILVNKGTFFVGMQVITKDRVKEFKPTYETKLHEGVKKQIVMERNRLSKKNQVFSEFNGGGEITILLKNYDDLQVLSNISEGEMKEVLESLREWHSPAGAIL
jgi:hypothetical protein